MSWDRTILCMLVKSPSALINEEVGDALLSNSELKFKDPVSYVEN